MLVPLFAQEKSRNLFGLESIHHMTKKRG